MPDQLFLDLAVAVPRLPATLRPMLARPAPAPFDSPDHLFEPSWGGLRALALVEPDPATGALGLRLLDEAGDDVAAAFPELAGLPDALASPFAALDGELIVPDGSGRADAQALAGRLRAGSRRPATRVRRAVYLAFDLLYVDGRPLLAQPLAKRRQRLAGLVAPTADVLVVPAIGAEGLALYEAAVEQGLPAILARHARSPYLEGRRSGLWQLISTRTATGGRPRPAVESAEPGEAETDARRPVLALIRKLPLPLDDG